MVNARLVNVKLAALVSAGLLALGSTPGFAQEEGVKEDLLPKDPSTTQAEPDGAEPQLPPPNPGSNPATNQASQADLWIKSDAAKRNAISVGGGMFHRGWYSVWNTESGGFVACNAWTLCGEELFGVVASVDYTRRLRHSGDFSLDLDVSAAIANQNIQNSWYEPIPPGQQEKTFGLLSVVPTVRWRLPKPIRPLTFGVGIGLNYAIGNIPYEYPYDIPLNVAVNVEIAYQPAPSSNYQIFAALRHRCAGYGFLNDQDNARPGTQYYMLGFRAWL